MRYSEARFLSSKLGLHLFLFLVALFVSAGVCSAYSIVLKDGSTVQAAKAPEVRGELAYITLVSGTVTTLRATAIDFEKTKAVNTNNLGSSATVIDGREVKPLGTSDTRREDTLADLMQRKRESGEAVGEQRVRVPKTPSGFDDLQSYQRLRYEREEVAAELRSALTREGLGVFEIHRGTRDDRVFIEVEARDEKTVFNSLLASARGLRHITEQYDNVSALELLMVTRGRTRSAQFVLTDELVALLLDEGMTPGRFFYHHVQF